MRYLLPAAFMAALAAGIAGGCDDSPDDAAVGVGSSDSAAAPADALPADLLLSSAPEGARSVAEVRASAGEGETVVVRGVVGGREDPIAENRAILTLLDESVQTCDKNPSDGCKTPWDACCEPQDVIAAGSATVQVVDAKGQPLKASLRGQGNLAPLSRIVVVGTYRPSPDGKAAVIDATGIYVDG